MRRMVILGLAMLFILSSFAADGASTNYDAIRQDYIQGNISEQEYVENLVYSVKNPDMLDSKYSELVGPDDGTIALVEAYNIMQTLPEATRERLRPMFSRPWGLSQTYGTSHFLFHYTTSGSDATTASFVTTMGSAFEAAWDHLNSTRGFEIPPSDGSAGGDNRYDVYIRNLSSGILGYCEPEANVPSTPENDATSFINMRNSYSSYSYSPTQLMQQTAVHELFHSFQMGYDVGEEPWFMEVSSVWIEDDLYPSYDEEHSFLSVFFNNPDVTITTYNSSHEYGSYHFATYLTEKFGDDTMFEIWDQCKWVSILAAIQGVASDNGSSRNACFSEFFVWNLFTGSRSGLGHYPEGNLFPEINIEDVVYSSDYPVAGGSSSSWPDHLASNYFELTIPGGASGPFSVTFDGEDGGIWSAQIVIPGASAYDVLDISLDANGYGYITIPESTYTGHTTAYLVVGMLSTSGEDWTFNYSAAFDTIAGTLNAPRNLIATSGVAGSVPLDWEPPIGGGGDEWIFYDDGTGVSYYGSTTFGSGTIEAVRFTYTSPCTLLTARFQCYSTTTPYDNVMVRVYNESGGDMPGTEIGTGRVFSPAAGTWNDCDVSSEGIALPAGDFFIGIERVGDEPGVLMDDSTTTTRNIIIDDSLAYYAGGDFLIRAEIRTGGSRVRLSPLGIEEFVEEDIEDAPEPSYLSEPIRVESILERPAEPVSHYNIYRSTTTGGPWITPIATSATDEYNDMSVVDGTTYYYVVTAEYGSGESGYSNQVSALPGEEAGDTSSAEIVWNVDTSSTATLMLWLSDGWAEVLTVDRPAKLVSLVYGIYTTGSGLYWPGLHHWADNRIMGELMPRIEEPCGWPGDTGYTYYLYDVEPYDIYVNGDFVVSMRQVSGNEYIVHQVLPSTDDDFLYNDSLNYWFNPDTGRFLIGAVVEYADSTQRSRISGAVSLAGGTGGSPPPTDLSGSIVKVEGTDFVDTTDATGHYEIDSLPPGIYVVNASRIWYEPQSAMISVGSHDENHNFNLIPYNLPVNPPRFVSAESFHDSEVHLRWLGPVGSPGTEQWMSYWEWPDSMFYYRSRLPVNSVECTRFDVWAPCTLTNVRMSFYDSLGVYDNIEFHIWGDDGSGYPDFSNDLISPLSVAPVPFSSTAGLQWTFVNLDSMGIGVQLLPGDQIHIGFKHITSHPSLIFDDSTPLGIPTRSKIFDADAGWDSEMADFLVEVHAEYFEYEARPSRPPEREELGEIRYVSKLASSINSEGLPRLRPMEGTTVDFYDIYRTDDLTDTTSFALVASVPGDSNTFVDAPVTNDTWQYYYIKTHQSHGISDRSSIVYAYPKAMDDTAHVLLVDDDGSSWAGGIDESWAYIQALLDAGIGFNGIDLDAYESPSLAMLEDHEAVIWFTGILSSDSTTLKDEDELNLTTYLLLGGNLALFSQDYLWDRYNSGFSSGDFPTDYFGLDSASQDNWQITERDAGALGGYVGGLFDSMAFIVTSPFGSFDLWPDHLYGETDLAALSFGTSMGPVITGKDGPGYKSVLSTVPLAALIDTLDPSTKEEFMRRLLLDYFRVIGPGNVEHVFNMTAGWHMVSTPVIMDDMSADSIFPARYGPLYYYDPDSSAYIETSEVEPGRGYFVLYTNDTTYSIFGEPVEGYTRDLFTGWNQVGGVYADTIVPFSSAIFVPNFFITGNFYEYSGASGYTEGESFDPGIGYWVLVSGACAMQVGEGGGSRRDIPEIETLKLNFEGSEINIGRGEELFGYVPPNPPNGAGQIAYVLEGENRCLTSIKENGSFQLIVENSGRLDYSNRTDCEYYLNLNGESKSLSGEGSIYVKAGKYTISDRDLPESFALYSARPNPFNAKTTIRFDTPEECEVELSIYDLSGRRIRTLISEEYRAGRHSVVWNGKDKTGDQMPSGVYFYRLNTESGFSSTRKMMLVK